MTTTYLRLEEVASILGCDRNEVYYLLDREFLSFVQQRPGGHRLVPQQVLREYIYDNGLEQAKDRYQTRFPPPQVLLELSDEERVADNGWRSFSIAATLAMVILPAPLHRALARWIDRAWRERLPPPTSMHAEGSPVQMVAMLYDERFTEQVVFDAAGNARYSGDQPRGQERWRLFTDPAS